MDLDMIFQPMIFESFVITPLQFAMAGVALLVMSLTSLYFIDKYDEPRKPRIVGNGIKERLCWILFFFILMVAFIANNGYFIGSLSRFQTFNEKFQGVPELFKEAKQSFEPVDTKALRNLSPDYFKNATLLISKMDDKHCDAAIAEIEQSEEWKSFVAEVYNYGKFFLDKADDLANFEKLRLTRVGKNNCSNDYAWKLNPFQIKARINERLLDQMELDNVVNLRKYATDMKTEIPEAMRIETGNVSRHVNKFASFNEFLELDHLEYLAKVKENRRVTKSLADQHHYAVLIMCGFTFIGVVYNAFLMYVVIQLIRHKDVDYLRTPPVGTFTEPEIFRNCLEFCQNTAWCLSCLLAIIFVVLWSYNMIAPKCRMGFFRSEDRITSFYSNDTLHSDEMFRKCAGNRTTTITDLFGNDIFITPEKLAADIPKNIKIEPLNIKFYEEIARQHELNKILHELLDFIIAENCPTGVPIEELEAQQQVVQTFIDRGDDFEKAVETFKSKKLQSLIHNVILEHAKEGIKEAANVINDLIKQNDLECNAISMLNNKCWRLNCQEHSYFDESLIHWVVICYLFIIFSFSILRIFNLNEQSAEDWEIQMANAPKYFGKNTSNPRHVRNPRE